MCYYFVEFLGKFSLRNGKSNCKISQLLWLTLSSRSLLQQCKTFFIEIQSKKEFLTNEISPNLRCMFSTLSNLCPALHTSKTGSFKDLLLLTKTLHSKLYRLTKKKMDSKANCESRNSSQFRRLQLNTLQLAMMLFLLET